MRLQMQAIHFDADAKLLSFIQQKMDKLDTFYDRIISGEVFLKLDKSEKTKISRKLLEIKLYVPGGTLFVKEGGTTFEEATDLSIESLKMQVKKFKNKKVTKPKIIKTVITADAELEEVTENI